MAAVTVRALKPFRYQGRTIVVGEAVTFQNPVEALAKARAGVVSLDRAYNARAVVAEHEPESTPEQTTRRRRYRRRDLKAED